MNELCAANTFFIKKSHATKYCTLRNVFYTTYFIFIRQKDIKFIRDSGVNKAHINSNNRGIFISFNCNDIHRKDKLARKSAIPQYVTKISWLNLRDKGKRIHFTSEVSSLFNKNESYPNLATLISEAARKTFEYTHPSNPPWFTLSS